MHCVRRVQCAFCILRRIVFFGGGLVKAVILLKVTCFVTHISSFKKD